MQTSSLVDVHSRLLKARIQLSLRQPFLASALMRLPIKDVTGMSWCRTMATDGYHIFFNANWVKDITDVELRGVVAHELLHVLFSHSTRCGNRSAVKWNIACDYAINLLLVEQGFLLPIGGLMSREFVGLPAEEIYSRLMNADDDEVFYGGIRGLPVDGTEDAPGILKEAEDDLLAPDDPRVVGAIGNSDMDAQERRDLIATLRSEAKTKLHGNSGAWFRSECDSAESAKIDWRSLLRQWLFDRIRTDWSLWPPSKKHLHRGFIFPSIGVEAPGMLIFAVDTSASMTEGELSSIFSEIRSFRETFPCKLTVLQADTDVRDVAEFEAMDGSEFPKRVEVVGRGGTDFRPVFDWIQDNSTGSPSALVYATDGYGTFPKSDTGFPVIWIRTRISQDESKFPFGLVVSL
jgi:predicted metal-dependent peptidase